MAARMIEMDDVQDADFSDVSNVTDENERIEQDILAEIGASEDSAEYELRVFRVPPSGQGTKLIWLFTVAGSESASILQRLRDDYGTGTYEARIWRTVNGKTMAAKRHRHTMRVEKLARHDVIENRPSAQDSALLSTVNKQGELLNMLFEKLTTITAPTPPPPPPPAPSMIEMFSAMGAAMKAMRSFMPEPVAVAAAPAPDPFSLMTKALEFAKSMQSDGREKGMFDIVGDLLNSPLAQQLANQFAQNAQGATPVAPNVQRPQLAPPQSGGAPRAPQPQQAPVNNAPAPVSNGPSLQNDFPQVIERLVLKASKGSDPFLHADILADEYPETELAQLIATPNILDLLAQSNPGVQAHKQWFADVLDGLKDHFENDENTGAQIPPLAPLTTSQGDGQMPGAQKPDPEASVVSRAPSPALNPDGPS